MSVIFRSGGALSLLFFSTLMSAQSITLEPIDFGTVALLSSTYTRSIVLKSNGEYSHIGRIYPVKSPKVGSLIVTDFPTNQLLQINGVVLDPVSRSDRFSNMQFRLTNIDIPTLVSTDDSGSAYIAIGGTLEAPASQANDFSASTYLIRYQLTVNY